MSGADAAEKLDAGASLVQLYSGPHLPRPGAGRRMRIGIPREIKDGEFRVALTPAGVGGDRGTRSSSPELGAAPDFPTTTTGSGRKAGNPWDCDLVVKVKELQEAEYRLPRQGQTVFCFQHFDPEPELLDAALATGATFVAFETVGQATAACRSSRRCRRSPAGSRCRSGVWCLQKQNGGSGVLLRGLDGVAARQGGDPRRRPLSARTRSPWPTGMGARVCRVREEREALPGLERQYPKWNSATTGTLADARRMPISSSAASSRPGQMSPKLITRAMLRGMRPGSVLVDVGIDQGGIAETSRTTSHSEPIYVEEGVVHYCVPNMPAAFARTASLALEKAVLPFVLRSRAERLSHADLGTGIQVTGRQSDARAPRPRHRERPTAPMKRTAVALIDESRCIGCTRCIDACPVDAIAARAGLMHTVIAAYCTGCELCLPPCPVDCIDMVPTRGGWNPSSSGQPASGAAGAA